MIPDHPPNQENLVCVQDCIPGEYYDESKLFNGCTQCGVGKSGPDSTRTYAQVLATVNMGLSGEETECNTCKTNEFQDIPGNTSCKPCGLNEFQNILGNGCVQDTTGLLDELPTAFVPCRAGEATDLKIDSEAICFKMWSIFFNHPLKIDFFNVPIGNEEPPPGFPTGCTGMSDPGNNNYVVFWNPVQHGMSIVPSSLAFQARTLCSTALYNGNVICDRTEGNIENLSPCKCGDRRCTPTTGLFCKTDTAGVHGTCSGYENNTAYYFDGEVMSVMDALQHKISYNNLKNC